MSDSLIKIKILKMILISFVLSFSQAVAQQSALDVAFKKSKLPSVQSFKNNTQNFEERVHLSIQYLQKDTAWQYTLTPINEDMPKDLIEKIIGDQFVPDRIKKDKGALLANLDMWRQLPEAIDSEGRIRRTGCRIRALLFSELLVRSGIPKEKIHIVETVNIEDLRAMCPSKGNPAIPKKAKNGFSGHTYITIDYPDGSQRLINPSLGSDKNNNDQGYKVSFNFDARGFSGAMIPREAAAPYQSLTSALVVFNVSQYGSEPYYPFTKRPNLIASGSLKNNVCRMSGEEQTQIESENLLNIIAFKPSTGNKSPYCPSDVNPTIGLHQPLTPMLTNGSVSHLKKPALSFSYEIPKKAGDPATIRGIRDGSREAKAGLRNGMNYGDSWLSPNGKITNVIIIQKDGKSKLYQLMN